jgi:hypothetical protein
VAALGAWLVGADVAQRIVRLGREQRRPYLVEVERPDVLLWANEYSSGFSLTLGVPEGESTLEELTWEDWFGIRGVDYRDRKEVREHLIEFGCFDPADGLPFRLPHLKARIPEGLQQYYLEYDYGQEKSSAGRAFNYLANLDLASRRAATSEPLGGLRFYDGCCPGNDAYLVLLDNVESIGGLQQRLLELGEKVAIQIA